MKLAALSIIALLMAAAPAWPGSIGLYSTSDCTSCNLPLQPGEELPIYIVFTGLSSTPYFDQVGLAAVEFRVVGLPQGWITQSVRAPAATIMVGDPFAGGTDIAFGSPQFGDCILLCTTFVRATSLASDVVLQVTRHETPNNPSFDCENAIPWNPPIFGARACVGGGTMFLNSSQECQVALQPSTWSNVKQLFE